MPLITLKMSFFTLKRISKNLVNLAILFIAPLVLITILGMIAEGGMDENQGIPLVDAVSLQIILTFQLFAGFYTLELMKQDVLEKRKWRMMSLPIPMYRYLHSMLIVTTIYGGIQSFLLTIYTWIVYDVTWGNQLRLILAILLISFFIQSIYLNIALYLRKYKNMERVAVGIALTSMLLGNVMFPLPDGPLFDFMGTYGNPYSLAENLLLDGMRGQFTTEGMLSMGILFSLGILLIISSTYRGRRAPE